MSKSGKLVELEGRRYLVISIPEGALLSEVTHLVHVALSRYVGPRFHKDGYPSSRGAKTPRQYPLVKLIETSETSIIYEVER